MSWVAVDADEEEIISGVKPKKMESFRILE